MYDICTLLRFRVGLVHVSIFKIFMKIVLYQVCNEQKYHLAMINSQIHKIISTGGSHHIRSYVTKPNLLMNLGATMLW